MLMLGTRSTANPTSTALLWDFDSVQRSPTTRSLVQMHRSRTVRGIDCYVEEVHIET